VAIGGAFLENQAVAELRSVGDNLVLTRVVAVIPNCDAGDDDTADRVLLEPVQHIRGNVGEVDLTTEPDLLGLALTLADLGVALTNVAATNILPLLTNGSALLASLATRISAGADLLIVGTTATTSLLATIIAQVVKIIKAASLLLVQEGGLVEVAPKTASELGNALRNTGIDGGQDELNTADLELLLGGHAAALASLDGAGANLDLLVVKSVITEIVTLIFGVE